MKIRYDAEVDALVITLRAGEYAESDEVSPGLIVDYDAAGQPLAIEVLQAGRFLAAESTLHLELPLEVVLKKAG